MTAIVNCTLPANYNSRLAVDINQKRRQHVPALHYLDWARDVVSSANVSNKECQHGKTCLHALVSPFLFPDQTALCALNLEHDEQLSFGVVLYSIAMLSPNGSRCGMGFAQGTPFRLCGYKRGLLNWTLYFQRRMPRLSYGRGKSRTMITSFGCMIMDT